MEDSHQYYSCPLCCNNTFDSKQSLLEHLIHISLNIVCTICNQNFSSLELLTEHLKVANCDALNADENAALGNDLCNIVKIEHDANSVNSDSTPDYDVTLQKNVSKITYKDTSKSNMDQETDDGKMYVELLGQQSTKPCLQTQEMKLVKEDGQSRYVILADEESLLNPDVTIVTKQNNDGTISLTALKETGSVPNGDIESDTEPVVNEDDRADKNIEELYTCNTCGVSFSSVLEHIQNYHTNEDVVVHDNGNTDLPMEFESGASEETAVDKQSSRRMITEAGNIVEAPVLHDQTVQTETETLIKLEPNEKTGRVVMARLLQVNAAPKTKSENKKSTYHRVVVKEMQAAGGGRVKLYNCITCNLYVTSIAEFKQQPCKLWKYQCPHCSAAYENSKSLCAHMKVHKVRNTDLSANIVPTKFECEICNTQFPTSKSLKLHKKMHDPIKYRPIEPPFETPEGMPASDDKYLCGVCNKLIPIDYRTIHQNSHKPTDKMNCDVCNKKFHSKDYLDMHMSVHKVDKVPVEKTDKLLPYNCLYCNRRFARPHEKVKHERIHTGEKPHSCEICGKSFRVSYCLTLHMRTHTGARPYACPHCNKRFKAHSVYNHHLLTHSEVRAYKCPFCPKAFKTSVQLAGHKNSHTKPFSCQQCNRPFASLYAVRVHMEIHTRQNSLKFACTLCGASYARAFALKDHVRQVHKQDVDTTDSASPLESKDWMVQENADVDSDGMPLNKDLPQDINELDIHTTELIIP